MKIKYFDNASTTFPKFKCLYENTMKLYEEIGINFNRTSSKIGENANSIKQNLNENIKKIYSAFNHEVILNSSATFSLNEILQGLDYTEIKNVYISPFEHNAVNRVIKKIEKEKKISVEILTFNDFQLDEEDMRFKFMSKKPDLVICTHASNAFGNILPIEIIFQEAKNYNAITVLDTAQTGGILDFSKISFLSDFLVFAGHKNLYGPSGIGGYLYNRRVSLFPLIYGGTGIKSEEEDMPEDIPERFEAGSPNILGIIGLKISTDELLKIGIEELRLKKAENLKKLMAILSEYDYDLEIKSEEENNIGVVSVRPNDYSVQEFGKILEDYGILVRTGLHCAPSAHNYMGTSEQGTIRFSVGYLNSDEDFEALREAFEDIF